MKKRLLISKADVPSEFLMFCNEVSIDVTAESFIEFFPVDFVSPSPDDFDIVFFTSPRSVHFFWSRYKYSTQAEIACIGEASAKALRKIGKEVRFTGNKSGDPQNVAKQFKQFAQQKKVLFPQSNVSNRSIQRQLDRFQIIDLVVYETRTVKKSIGTRFDMYIFTSPSNVQGFFGGHKEIPSESVVVSWGKSTSHELIKQGVIPTHTLEISSFEELQKVLLASI